MRVRKQLAIGFALLSMLFALLSAAPAAAASGYDYYVVGSSSDVTRSTTAGTVLMGGGTDVDAAFQWMISKSGGGDFVVIRTSGSDGYNSYVNGLGAVNSVETLVIKNRRAASNSFVVNKIRNAEALFIAGGDQATYVNYWKDTPIEDAIHHVISKNVPVGGTSAGLAILGEFVYTAQNGTVYSDEALDDPYNRYMMFARDFLTVPHLQDVITDSHFGARDRMGRLVGFLARMVEDGWASTAFGIGVDEATALLVDQNGVASLRGSGSAYFLRTPGRPEVCDSQTPLTFRNVSVYRISSSGSFNLASWSGSGGVSYSLSASNGSLSSTQSGGKVY